MDLCTIETSETEIDAGYLPAVDEHIVDPDQTEPSVVTVDPISEDDLDIEDEALVSAARDCQLAPYNRTRERAAWITAFTLAIFLHAAGAAICLMLAITIRAPRLSFTQGSGSSESGLVSENSNQTESQESGVPNPLIALAEPRKIVTAEPRPADEAPSDPEVSHERTPPVAVLEPDAQSLDSAVIGIATDPVGPMPAQHHSVPTKAVASAAPATPLPAPARAGTKATPSAPPGNAVAGRHSFVAPRGAGHPGIGTEGSGFDSRGLPVPEYPPESKRRHEEGLVELDVQVQPDGSIGAARIVKDSGYPRLNNAALASIRSARFMPAMMDGVPVVARVIVPYRFILQ